MNKLQRILVPVDFSTHSMKALEYAGFLARRFDARLDVLHVWKPAEYAGDAMVMMTRGDPEITLSTFLRNYADQQLTDFLKDVSHSERRLESGDPATTIVRVATEGQYDMVVMATHGRTGLSHMMMGSVAEKVVRLCLCPVLTCRVQELKS